jgi:hypothetical protein
MKDLVCNGCLAAHPDPAHGVKLHRENNRRLRYLTSDECGTLLDACHSLTVRQNLKATTSIPLAYGSKSSCHGRG